MINRNNKTIFKQKGEKAIDLSHLQSEDMIAHRLIKKVRSMNPWHFLWISVVLSEMFTVIANTIQSYFWWGFLSKDLLRIGAIDALFVPVLVAPFMLYFFWENKQMEKELSLSKQRLEDITQGIDEGIMLLSNDFRILWANKATLQQTGLSIQKLIGNYCFKATHHRESICEPPYDLCPASELFKTGSSHVVEHTHYNNDGEKVYVEVSAYPIRNEIGGSDSFVHITRDITERKQLESEKDSLILELQDALAKVKQLSGFLPICASCKNIRNDKGYWEQIEKYLHEHSEAKCSHGICPECAKKLYPEYYDKLYPEEENK